MPLQLSFHACNFRSDLGVAMGWRERSRRLLEQVDSVFEVAEVVEEPGSGA